MIITVGLVEDNYFTLSLYKEVFQNFKDIKLVFAVSSVDEISKADSVNIQHPDVILLDIELKNEKGIDYIPFLKQKYPEVKILMLTASDSEDDLLESLRVGACGYLIKDDKLFEIYTAIKKVVDDGAFICSRAAKKIVRTIQKQYDSSLTDILTKRELEMIEYVKQGDSYKEIAQRMFITTYTVNHHMKGIFRKLNVSTKAELISKLWSKSI